MQVCEVNDVKIEGMRVGFINTNCYIIYNVLTKEGCIVDPGGSAEKILAFINSRDIKSVSIYLTHGHFDHISAAKEIKEKTKAKIYAFETEKELMANPNANCAYMFDSDITLNADELLSDGQKVSFAGIEAKVINTPGHTKGSCCYYLEKEGILFSGDTLFYRTHGRTDLPTGSGADIVRSMEEILFKLPKDTKVYPGHGEFTTIGNEKNTLI